MVRPFSGHRSRRRRRASTTKAFLLPVVFCCSTDFLADMLCKLLRIRAEILFLSMMIFLGTGLKIFPMADFHHDLQKFSISEVAG